MTFLQGKNDQYVFDKQNVIKNKSKYAVSYSGYRHTDHAPVVIKQLHTHLQHDEAAVQRFTHEAGLQLQHPAIITTTEIIQHDNGLFAVRPFLSGYDLLALRKKKPRLFTAHFVARCGIAMLSALEYLHNQQLVHADIRPANMILCTNDLNNIDTNNPDIKLIDFELCRVSGSEAAAPFALIYSPPEQLLQRFHLINNTSDLSSLAVSMYQLLTGVVPFQHSNPQMLINLQLNTTLPIHKNIPLPLMNMLLKATAKHQFRLPVRRYTPQQCDEFLQQAQNLRYATATHFKNALEEFLQQPIEPKRRSWWLRLSS